MHNSKLNQCMCSVMKVLRHTQGVLSVWVAYLIKQTLIKNLIITGAQVFWAWATCSPCCTQYAQSYPTLCHPMDCSPPISPLYGIFQPRMLEWVAIYYSRGSFQPRNWTQSSVSPVFAGIFFTTEPPGKPSPCLALL